VELEKSKENNRNYKNSKGITLIPLIITVLLMMILVGVAITNGLQSADNAQLQKFFRELQIIQKRVDVIAEEAKAGNNSYITYNSETQVFRSNIGTEVTDESIPEVDDTTGYYLYSPIELEQLGVEGINQNVYINWATRDVVSVEGFTANGTTYYRDPSIYKPEYTETEVKEISTISLVKEMNGDIKKIIVTEVKTEDDVQVTDFTLKYKLDGETTWKIADSNYFKTADSGQYHIQVSGNGINPKEKTVYLYDFQKYQQVEYIESTGTQYIDTGYIPNNDNKIYAVLKIKEQLNSTDYFFGSDYAWNNGLNANISSDTLRLTFGDQVGYWSGYSEDTEHKMVLTSEKLEVNNTVRNITPTQEYVSESNLLLFTTNRNGVPFVDYCSSIKLYSFKIYENDVLERDFMPCYRKSDNAIGMYDIVNDKFYENEGTGTFLMGKSILDDYQQVEYIESTGTQYIDTEYIPKTKTKVECELSFNGEFLHTGNGLVSGAIFGTSDQENAFLINFGGGSDEGNKLYPWVDKLFSNGADNYGFYITNEIRTNKNLLTLQSGRVSYCDVSKTIATKTEDQTDSLILFGRRNASGIKIFNAYNMRLYSFKVYDNYVLVRDLMPCYRKSDNAIGMYDKVNDRFYENAGTGTFIIPEQ